MMTKCWIIKPSNPAQQRDLSASLGVHPVIAQLLINRQITSLTDAKMFLSADLSSLYDPFLLMDMDRAVARIRQAKENNEKILIYGDYDVDGVTSSALLRRLLKRIGVQAVNYIPHRMEDGYGLNDGIIPFVVSEKINLLITVDCGINAFGPVESLRAVGIDVIVIDHHEPEGNKLPQALAVINPKRKDCGYPFKNLSAVGLAAKLTHAMLGHLPLEDLDLIAIGTVADVVSLLGENRIFVKHGLPCIENTNKPGLKALLKAAKITGKKMRSYYIAFILGPRLNAAGRMDSAALSLDLLLSESLPEASALAASLEAHNQSRQKTQNTVLEEAIAMIEADESLKNQDVIVVYKQGWHKGVLGIVASRIVEKYARPVVVICVENGVGTGSARSVDGFHIHQALQNCAAFLDNYGGHKRAAGLRLKQHNIEIFRQAINDFAKMVLSAGQQVPSLHIDCEIPLNMIDLNVVEMVASLEPYGEGNPMPVFCSRALVVKSPPALLGRDTLKFWVSDGQKTLNAVAFGMGDFRDRIKSGAVVDLAFSLGIDDWNKPPAVQLLVKDIK